MADVHRLMTAAIEELEFDERPYGLGGPLVSLKARDLVRAAQVCLKHLMKHSGAKTHPEVRRWATVLEQHVLTTPGTTPPAKRKAFQLDLPTATDLEHARGSVRVAVLAALVARAELAGDGRNACEAAEEAARLTTRALRKSPQKLETWLRDLRAQLLTEAGPPQQVDEAPADAAHLLASVRDRPHELELRRVVADRLIELGDPLGTFMSLQCAKAGSREGLAEVEALLLEHEAKWLGRLEPVVGRAVFVHGMLDEVELADVTQKALAAVAGAPEWSTVRVIALGAHGVPTRLKPVPAAIRVLHDGVMRSLSCVLGANELLVEALADGPCASRLTTLGTSEGVVRPDVLARFSALRRLGVQQGEVEGLQSLEALDLSKLEALEVTTGVFEDAARLSERTPLVFRRSREGGRAPDYAFARTPHEWRAWVNLGMTSVPREQILRWLESDESAAWALTVYAKTMLPSERARLEVLRARRPDCVALTSSAADAPVVPKVT